MTNDESADLLIWRQKHHLSGFRTKVKSDNVYFEPTQKKIWLEIEFPILHCDTVLSFKTKMIYRPSKTEGK
jgi:hypothetical protein